MLHGEVKVNNVTIIEYIITNEGEGAKRAHTLYHFWVKGRDIHGYPYEYEWEEEISMLSTSAQELVSVALLNVARRLTGWANGDAK
jgi:hypothetical protein